MPPLKTLKKGLFPGVLIIVLLGNGKPASRALEASAEFSTRINHSGDANRVLLNSLVELTVSYSGDFGKIDHEVIDLETEFTSPSGNVIRLDARHVYRSGADHNWVSRIAPAESGEWTYRVLSAVRTVPVNPAKGRFSVHRLEGRKILSPDERPEPGFRVLYNNDLNNVLAGYPANAVPKLIQRSVDEVGSGVDVHLLSPSFTWVPMWRSDFYPMGEHVDWFRRIFGKTHSELLTDYIAEGGDTVDIFIKAARERGQTPFLSMRMNDQHYLDIVGEEVSKVRWKGVRAMRHRSRFYHENPEWRIGSGNTGFERVLNWEIPEVRGHMLSLLHEVVRKYEIDGIELDFLRYAGFFREDFPLQDRKEIMLGFVKQVRQLLDAYSQPDHYRWLAVRVPAYCDHYKGPASLGIDLAAFVKAGVDLVTLSASYITDQQSDFAPLSQVGSRWREALPTSPNTCPCEAPVSFILRGCALGLSCQSGMGHDGLPIRIHYGLDSRRCLHHAHKSPIVSIFFLWKCVLGLPMIAGKGSVRAWKIIRSRRLYEPSKCISKQTTKGIPS